MALKSHFEKPRWHNRGNPWSEVEDLKLIKLVAEAKIKDASLSVPWMSISNELGRTYCSVQNRYYSLKVGMRITNTVISIEGKT